MNGRVTGCEQLAVNMMQPKSIPDNPASTILAGLTTIILAGFS
jgi:hypothetical protein